WGRAGTEPDATDCEVGAGGVDPNGFLGGRMKLDAELARRAIETQLAVPLGLSIEEAALAATRILTHTMIQAIEVNSVRKGYDPREFALVAFGGAGPPFPRAIPRELSIPGVVVPLPPGFAPPIALLTPHVSSHL